MKFIVRKFNVITELIRSIEEKDRYQNINISLVTM
jgi:hypothetical protein